MTTVTEFFADDGPLSDIVAGYQVRTPQLTLSKAIERNIKNQTVLIAEAGTGTGKTFAYLVPALQSDAKTIISTGTKNLQEQLFKRDLPIVKNAIDKSRSTALLKGRSNYLCTYRLGLNGGDHMRLDKQTLHEYNLVKKWSSTTNTGDLGELTSLQEGASVIPLVTSTVDNCMGKDCKDYDACYLVKARQKAMSADIVVVNHHLFFADLSLKQDGFGELIPNTENIVFDEAHLLPDIASEYFGKSFSSRQLIDLLGDIHKIQKTALKDADQLGLMATKIQQQLSDVRLLFPLDPEKGELDVALKSDKLHEKIAKLTESLEQMLSVVQLHDGRDNDLDKYFERFTETVSRLYEITNVQQHDVSLWYETTKRYFTFHLTPLNIGNQFSSIVKKSRASWLFTSATISVGENFEHYQMQMGLHDASTLQLDSPFDYSNQAMLCVPRYLPAPNHPEMKQHLVAIAKKLIEASSGRVFFLFTSHYMMREVATRVAESLNIDVLVQGDASKQSLLHRFVKESATPLFATGAFWEGVDVKGEALQCVMIDKLPFASPDDPLLKARIKDCRKQGQEPFTQVQIPQAVITLKQGAGRLIRDVTDKGVLVICDNRLVNKQYAKTFLASLPSMKRTRCLENIFEFLSR